MKPNHKVSDQIELAKAEAHVIGKANHIGKGGKILPKPVEPAKPSAELVGSTLRPFARRMATAWESFHSACKTIYRDCLEAWETVTHAPHTKRTRESVNAFHKALKPILTAESGMEDGTIRNLLAKCRKENGLPDGISPERKKQMAVAKAKAQRVKDATKGDKADGGGKVDPGGDVISITIASKTTSFALSADGEEVDNSVEGLYAILVKLQKVYGETLLEAVNKLMELDPAVNE